MKISLLKIGIITSIVINLGAAQMDGPEEWKCALNKKQQKLQREIADLFQDTVLSETKRYEQLSVLYERLSISFKSKNLSREAWIAGDRSEKCRKAAITAAVNRIENERSQKEVDLLLIEASKATPLAKALQKIAVCKVLCELYPSESEGYKKWENELQNLELEKLVCERREALEPQLAASRETIAKLPAAASQEARFQAFYAHTQVLIALRTTYLPAQYQYEDYDKQVKSFAGRARLLTSDTTLQDKIFNDAYQFDQ